VIEVKLSPEDALMVVVAAAVHQMRATKGGWVGNDHGGKGTRNLNERWADTILGFMGEIAVCKWLDRCWQPSITGIKAADVSGTIHVRTTVHSTGHLIIYGNEVKDYSGQRFILVTGHWPILRLRGWLFAQEGAIDKYRKEETQKDKNVCYWLPQTELSDMADFNKG
jgi:hypothetical protein